MPVVVGGYPVAGANVTQHLLTAIGHQYGRFADHAHYHHHGSGVLKARVGRRGVPVPDGVAHDLGVRLLPVLHGVVYQQAVVDEDRPGEEVVGCVYLEVVYSGRVAYALNHGNGFIDGLKSKARCSFW